MRRFLDSCLFLFFAAGICCVAAADFTPKVNDWPQWQGPERTAICKETGLLKSWPKDGPPLVWKATKLGGGFSAPSIAAGRIFGMGSRDRDEVVWALDEATGKELWTTRMTEAMPKVDHGEGPRGTPTVDGDKLYAMGIGANLACLETKTGKIVWKKDLAKEFDGKVKGRWGYSESPLVDGDKVVVAPGGSEAGIVALNKSTGEVIWKTAIPGGAGYSSAVVAEVGSIRQYVHFLKSGLVGVAAKDGKLLWKYDKVANGIANITTPIVKGDLVFASSSYKTGSALIKLVPSGDGIKAEEVYFLGPDEFQNHHGGLVLVGDYIYGGHGQNDGKPTCVEFKTGKIKWQERGVGTGSAAVLYADGKLYFRYQNGVLALIDASPTALKVISKFNLPEQSGKESWPHPVIANGKLYIRDQDVPLCFDVKERA